MNKVQRRLSEFGTKHKAPDFSTAEYLDAFSSIDRNIRSLINGNTAPKCSSPLAGTSVERPQTHARSHGLDSPISATLLPPRPFTSDRERYPEKVFSRLPPGLDIIGNDGGDDEEATVAFLCSGLPHYEGTAPIHYDDLDLSLDTYYAQWQNDFDQTLEEEEFVPDSAWEAENQLKPQQLPSPQTLRQSSSDPSILAYEGWIDFDELLEVVQNAIDRTDRLVCRIGRRSETDFMLNYAVESQPDLGQSWLVQVPKPAVSQSVFQSEILSLAYVNEHTQLPVPAVLAYDFSPSNSVGVPYAVLEKMPGEPLADHWPQLESRMKRRVLDSIADAVVQFSTLQFSQIGSLAIGDGEVTVGPLLHARQFEEGYLQASNVATRKHSLNGPFDSTQEYHHAMIQASLDVLSTLEADNSHYAQKAKPVEPSLDYIELETYASLVEKFANDDNDSGPFALMPESLDMHHFYIDPHTCALTGIVDWTFCGTRPLATLVQPPPFTFDDTPRWEPVQLDARQAYRRNLIRYRQWFKAGLQKKAWAMLGKAKSDKMADLVRTGYWRYKFETEICENIQYSNPWTFRAIREHMHPKEEFSVWFATAQAKPPL
ncbi:hypothetical protein IWW40_005822 [Coemansia sp. RSA 1250]|nr:hypothetical protein IWW40_005822 [Coemansia sp. RSA 1250]